MPAVPSRRALQTQEKVRACSRRGTERAQNAASAGDDESKTDTEDQELINPPDDVDDTPDNVKHTKYTVWSTPIKDNVKDLLSITADENINKEKAIELSSVLGTISAGLLKFSGAKFVDALPCRSRITYSVLLSGRRYSAPIDGQL